MIRIEDAVEVAVAAEVAFAFVTRIADYPAWLPGVLRAEPAGAAPTGAGAPATGAGTPAAGAGTPAPDAGPPAPGAGFRLVSAGPGGMEIVSTGHVEAVDPPRSIAISATSGFFGLSASCEVTPLGATRARIAVRAGIEPRGLATLAAGRIEQELRASVPDTLRRLQAVLEGSADRPDAPSRVPGYALAHDDPRSPQPERRLLLLSPASAGAGHGRGRSLTSGPLARASRIPLPRRRASSTRRGPLFR